MCQKVKKYKEVVKMYNDNYYREPTIYEVAEELNVSIDKVKEIYCATFDTISIYSKNDEDEEINIAESLPLDDYSVEDIVMRKEFSEKIMNIMKQFNISDTELNILLLRSTIKNNKRITLEEIGKIYNVTREYVRQVEIRALKKIRNSKLSDELAYYTDNPEKSLKFLKENRRR